MNCGDLALKDKRISELEAERLEAVRTFAEHIRKLEAENLRLFELCAKKDELFLEFSKRSNTAYLELEAEVASLTRSQDSVLSLLGKNHAKVLAESHIAAEMNAENVRLILENSNLKYSAALSDSIQHGLTDDIAQLQAENQRLRIALTELVFINEQHNSAVEEIIGKQVGWSDSYLDNARKALEGK